VRPEAPHPDLGGRIGRDNGGHLLGGEDLSAVRGRHDARGPVHVEPDVGYYIVDLAAATRARPSVLVGASPRGSLALVKLARARALLDGRDFVTPDDVKAVAVPALAHRLVLHPELWVSGVSGEDVVRQCLDLVPTPQSVPTVPTS